MAFAVYVLSSLRNGWRYVGFTSRTIEERLAEHNRGYPSGWSSRNGPFELTYEESYDSEAEARHRERFLKSGRGREWLKAKLAVNSAPAGPDLAAYSPKARGDS